MTPARGFLLALEVYLFSGMVVCAFSDSEGAFFSCKVWGYEWLGVVGVELAYSMQKWLVLGNQQFFHSPQTNFKS